MKKALILLSGGQDSVTCFFWAQRRFEEIECISFFYGQQHDIEVEFAKKLCDEYSVKHTIVDISFLSTIVQSELTKENGDVNKKNDLGLPSSFVPNRNQIFLTIAHSYAQKIGANRIITGVCQTDYSGYPDCRREFINLFDLTTNTGSGIKGTNKEITIVTPLMYLTKAQTFHLAEKEGYIQEVIDKSYTCYKGSIQQNAWGLGCGKCPACELRAKGYYEFLEDKIPEEYYDNSN